MGDGLAHRIIDAHESSLGVHHALHRFRKPLNVQEKGSNKFAGKVRQRLEVAFGNQQTVPRKQRTVIEERDRYCILEDDSRIEFASDDPAEKAIRPVSFDFTAKESSGIASAYFLAVIK